MFIWQDSYSVHIPMIDEQHKKLFKIGDAIYTELQNKDHAFETIVALILEMVDYTKYHFNTEEELMKEYHYPNLEAHELEHNSFVDYIDSLSFIDLNENQDDLLNDMVNFLFKWILKHISQTDYEYSLFIQEKNKSES